jgi:tetratricopeptide (TPR) repeat protein
MRGRYFWFKRTREGMMKSLEYFQSAIEKDPLYALAYVGMADCYTLLCYYGHIFPWEAFPKAKALIEKALKIDDHLAEAYAALGWINLAYDWDWAVAEDCFKKALAIDPDYESAHRWYASYYLSMGRYEEALRESRIALDLDPLSLIANAEYGNFLRWTGRLDEAEKQLFKTLDMDSTFTVAHVNLGDLYFGKQEYTKAIKAFQKDQDNPWARGCLGDAYARAGEVEKARAIIGELNQVRNEKYIRPTAIGRVYQGLGEIERALDWYEKAYEERDPTMAFFRLFAYKESALSSNSRYKAIIDKMGFEK